jgi:hypothetical protein
MAYEEQNMHVQWLMIIEDGFTDAADEISEGRCRARDVNVQYWVGLFSAVVSM